MLAVSRHFKHLALLLTVADYFCRVICRVLCLSGLLEIQKNQSKPQANKPQAKTTQALNRKR
jgi:hypothetical protein